MDDLGRDSSSSLGETNSGSPPMSQTSHATANEPHSQEHPGQSSQKSDSSDTDEPLAKHRRLNTSLQDRQDGATCPICFDTWNNSGPHRLVALKCGHLFGYSCIQRWMQAVTVAERKCPTCKSKATLRDIRHIYARQVIAADTSEIISLKNEIEALNAQNNRLELELHKYKIAHQSRVQQVQTLEDSIARNSIQNNGVKQRWRYSLEKNIQVSREGGCRVLVYNCRRHELLLSQKSTNALFPGFGIRKFGCVDRKLGSFIHLHPKPIRDLAYSPSQDYLLSVSLDGTARLLDRDQPSTTIRVNQSLWSCDWDEARSDILYVGGVGGTVWQYDLRNTSNALQTLTALDQTPVVSVCSTEHGLLSCQLNSSWLWSLQPHSTSPYSLPVDGPFLSLCYHKEFGKVLISCRPGAGGPGRSRLEVGQLCCDGEMTCNIVQTFNGSTRASLMSRACWVSARGRGCSTWAGAYSESDSALVLHGLDGAESMTLPATDTALDICSFEIDCDSYLASVSDSKLRLYKAILTS